MDAFSAFNIVLAELLVRTFYLAGMDGNSTNYINNRLTSRLTYLDWDRNIMGPIRDELWLEQGGSNSSDYFKLYSNENLIIAQNSSQGIDLGFSQVISAVGLADDTVLVANKLSKLSNILFLATNYCEKYGVTLSQSKTKLLRISRNCETELEVYNRLLLMATKLSSAKRLNMSE